MAEANCLTYAVGDVHGRFDLLVEALVWIMHEQPRHVFKDVIFLGDYVDRGPQSRDCVELLMDMTRSRRVRCLKGNHEAMMVQAFHGVGEQAWLRLGGKDTLQAYGVEAARDLPREHITWMESLPTRISDDHRHFVHAGLMPDEPLEAQREEWLLWIRQPFLDAEAEAFPDRRHIVHGHTPEWRAKRVYEVELLAHRTNLDTGAFATGMLAVGVFDRALPGGPCFLKAVQLQDE